ncbi:MAG TPA: cytochrome c biogenesis protein CcsA [Chthoniobacteraceae bacterium]|nr:cytochrome c biogenesis protein CcsA [Chthoniobacteraceae bacterium]
MERLLLILSTICFLLGFAYTAYLLRKGRHRHSRFNLCVMGIGFGLQTWFLHLRGQAIGRCPLTNFFEILIFMSWSIVLLYLLIGPTYRLSLLGAFTSPLVCAFQIVALLAPIDTVHALGARPDPWLEMHAALSIIAYGAFAMAGVAGVMYIAQERQLKNHRLGSFFYEMPPIMHLAVANTRLLWAGLILLSVGLLCGFMVNAHLNAYKIGWGVIMWCLYLAILVARRLGPRRVALLSVGAFSLSLTALLGLNFMIERVRL